MFEHCLANLIWKEEPGLQISLLQLDSYFQITYQQIYLKPDMNLHLVLKLNLNYTKTVYFMYSNIEYS